MKTIIKRLLAVIGIFTFAACGEKHLGDRVYLFEGDEGKLTVAYKNHESSFSTLVDGRVMAVGYNDEYIIVKQAVRKQPKEFYYIIAIDSLKREREKFVPGANKVSYNSVYTSVNNIRVLAFTPTPPSPLTINEFNIKLKELNARKRLHFTMFYDDFAIFNSSMMHENY